MAVKKAASTTSSSTSSSSSSSTSSSSSSSTSSSSSSSTTTSSSSSSSKVTVPYPPVLVPLSFFIRAYLLQSSLGCTAITVVSFGWYSAIVEACSGISDQLLFTLFLSLSHIAVYFVCNAALIFLPLDQYKFHRQKHQVPSESLVQWTLASAVLSQLVTSPALTYALFPGFKSLGMLAMNAPLPSLSALAWTYLLAHTVNEWGFYFSHRLLHMPMLYAAVHKQHHEYKGSIGLAAEYAHPFEVVFSNIIPSISGVVLFGCHHPLCIIVWLSVRLHQTYLAHSGMALQGTLLDAAGFAHADSAAFHDCHHTSNRGNYGSILTDWLFRTIDSEYLHEGLAEGYIARHVKKDKVADKE